MIQPYFLILIKKIIADIIIPNINVKLFISHIYTIVLVFLVE